MRSLRDNSARRAAGWSIGACVAYAARCAAKADRQECLPYGSGESQVPPKSRPGPSEARKMGLRTAGFVAATCRAA